MDSIKFIFYKSSDPTYEHAESTLQNPSKETSSPAPAVIVGFFHRLWMGGENHYRSPHQLTVWDSPTQSGNNISAASGNSAQERKSISRISHQTFSLRALPMVELQSIQGHALTAFSERFCRLLKLYLGTTFIFSHSNWYLQRFLAGSGEVNRTKWYVYSSRATRAVQGRLKCGRGDLVEYRPPISIPSFCVSSFSSPNTSSYSFRGRAPCVHLRA
jgi:hypothetical protein